MSSVFWCSSCLTMSTRNRITFDQKGRCNACQWAERKKTLDWSIRKSQLEDLLDKNRSSNKDFDCLVPVSGGKDGGYVSYQLKEKYGMNPLCITVKPPLQLEIGNKNLKNFINSGYSLISIDTDINTMQYLNKLGFVDMGLPYFGWLIAIQSIPIRFANHLGINLIFYGEDGEVEYGGSEQTNKTYHHDVNYMKKVYFEGGYDEILSKAESQGLNGLELFKFPRDNDLKESQLKILHWSYFENWDPYRNYLVAKKHCGLIENEETNSGTFTNFAQNDQALYSLHAYLMYLKFGFGRANQDACIDIRRGAMDRDQGVNLVKLYDGQYPSEFIDLYLDYYQISKIYFDDILDKWTNKKLFKKEKNELIPLFEII